MNKIIGLVILALGMAACNGGMTKNDSNEINSDLVNKMRAKELQDSLTLDSFRRVEAEKASLIEHEKAAENQRASAPIHNTEKHSVSNPSASNSATQAKKKGWSDAAKGTAIGAGVGAGVGALIDKDKRLRGAAIGAAIGGGSGYAIGRKSDRKSGRVQKK